MGAVVGGVVGGTAAYNSAKESGLEGSDLFWATARGVGEGAVIGGVGGGLIGATGGVIATYGLTSVAGTAMITTTATVAAKATEVSVLQVKKSSNEGQSGWQVTNNCVESLFNNGGKILSPTLTKSASTSGKYLWTDISKYKVVPLGVNDYLNSPGGKLFPYVAPSIAWVLTVLSIFCKDPVAKANERGYALK